MRRCTLAGAAGLLLLCASATGCSWDWDSLEPRDDAASQDDAAGSDVGPGTDAARQCGLLDAECCTSGAACASDLACTAGRCAACASAQTRCGGVCVDLLRDSDHCGSCEQRCASGTRCRGGECR